MVFWAKTIMDELQARRRPAAAEPSEVDACRPATRPAGPPAALPARAARRRGRPSRDDDPELDDYNAYLARLDEQVKGHGRWHGLR